MNDLMQALEAAKAHLITNRKQPYYDEHYDATLKEDYYRAISDENELIKNDIQALIIKTHLTELTYSPHRYVYPWVDLQENGELKSLYSGKKMDALKTIEQDIKLLEQIKGRGIGALSGQNILNCEHVVPQSWFDEKEPMRGDLHHLFACEPSCNSMRSNFPYFDFPSYTPEGRIFGIREGCGMVENGRFEPEYGKGIVARATLYFFIRYEGAINIKEKVDLNFLLDWHHSFPVSIYEKHRNAAIHELQGNRNPFIDYPEWAARIINTN
ncbi:endonuclease I family protein [Bacillus sp. V33-4]|uniref:endonuclease I family protein n=1 Tax=Bacillus sp. V33-4 TaxID=2054169 RepID=UPI000C77CFEA|nr:endonuclease [Bacillus sp. V33-4]PLR82396.1 endonuclease I [Bacillus sp. V33-4]